MRRTTMLLTALVFVLSGCADFRQTYPTWPQWGWWDHKVKPTPDTPAPADEEAADAGDVEDFYTASARNEVSPSGGTVPEPMTPGQAEAEFNRVEQHRARVWPKVKALRDSGDLPETQRRAMMADASANLIAWYAPLDVAPPDPTDENFVAVMVWDFMPMEEFFQARETWRRIAEAEGKTLPEIASRRHMANWVLEFTKVE